MKFIRILGALSLFNLTACPLLEGGGGGVEALLPNVPGAVLQGLQLADRPSNTQLASFYCADFAGNIPFAGDACRRFFGPTPRRNQLIFSFDTVFDLTNSNDFAIPTVEMLLGLNVFEGSQGELGTVCVSFCDPEVEECDQEADQGCQDPDKSVDGIEDLVPTVQDLVNVATKAAAGDSLFDSNLAFRMIPAQEMKTCMGPTNCESREIDGEESICCGGTCEPLAKGCSIVEERGQVCQACPGHLEARVRFNLGAETIIDVLGQLVSRSSDDLLRGALPQFDIPYKARGSLFFNVPVLGRLAIGYGPLPGIWSLD